MARKKNLQPRKRPRAAQVPPIGFKLVSGTPRQLLIFIRAHRWSGGEGGGEVRPARRVPKWLLELPLKWPSKMRARSPRADLRNALKCYARTYSSFLAADSCAVHRLALRGFHCFENLLCQAEFFVAWEIIVAKFSGGFLA